MRGAMHRLKADDGAATAIEYGLMGALVGLALLTAASTTGVSLGGLFNSVFVEVEKARCVEVGSNCKQ